MLDAVEDPLKELADVLKPDTRQSFMLGDLSDYHSTLSAIKLNDEIPIDVRQLFETAKNVSLYTYFVYRFHQVAEAVGYAVLELALKSLCERDAQSKDIPNGLSKLMFYAKKKKWIDNDYFEDLEASTIVGIQQRRKKQAEREKKKCGEIKLDPNREITGTDIKNGINESVAVDGFIYLTLSFRNDLAHGSKKLIPYSMSMLARMAEVINYMYRNQAS